MGAQPPEFADGFIAAVSTRLGAGADRLVWQPVYWAAALEAREDALWAAMEEAAAPDGSPIPLDWRAVRKFVVHNFGDAMAYHRDRSRESAAVLVHQIISRQIDRLAGALWDPDAPIVVCAHSLGAHMMSNYIWDRQHERESRGLAPLPTLAAMITFGCNIPLFSLAFENAQPIDLPGAGVRPAVLLASRWLNFLDRDDALGWPMRPLYARYLSSLTEAQRRTVEKIEDREINVGNAVKSWNPGAHEGYWTDDDFTRPVADYLARLLEAVDT